MTAEVPNPSVVQAPEILTKEPKVVSLDEDFYPFRLLTKPYGTDLQVGRASVIILQTHFLPPLKMLTVIKWFNRQDPEHPEDRDKWDMWIEGDERRLRTQRLLRRETRPIQGETHVFTFRALENIPKLGVTVTKRDGVYYGGVGDGFNFGRLIFDEFTKSGTKVRDPLLISVADKEELDVRVKFTAG